MKSVFVLSAETSNKPADMEANFSAITVVKATFSITESSKILEEVDDYSSISIPPVRPKGGQVFLYQTESVDSFLSV